MAVLEAVAELSHAEHDARQRQQCSQAVLELNAGKLRPGQTARWDHPQWSPLPYPGFAFQAMASADARNDQCIDQLEQLRDELVALADAPGRFYPLPSASFHQTVINTFSGDRLEQHLAQRGLLQAFPSRLHAALSGHGDRAESDTVQMSLIGLSLFRTAIGALGIFHNADHYARVMRVRAQAYDHPALKDLGLQRTRPFIGHVTLMYLEAVPSQRERCWLIDALSACNQRLSSEPLPYYMPLASLCEYQDLSAFAAHPVDLRLAI